MVAASGKCYSQNSTVRYKWANTLITTSQDRNNLLQDRVEKPALALYRTLAKLNNWRVLTKMVHIHWKVDATLNPSVSTFKKMTNRSGLWVSVAMTQLSFPFQIVWLFRRYFLNSVTVYYFTSIWTPCHWWFVSESPRPDLRVHRLSLWSKELVGFCSIARVPCFLRLESQWNQTMNQET